MNFYTLIFKQNITYRKFLSLVLVSAITIITVIVVLNYMIDPLRTFSHSNFLNNKQVDFDERQQKTNYLYFVNHNFDSVLLGSSRTTYIDQNLFLKEKVFNYGANNMTPYEYDKFIAYFIEITGHAPKKIYIGLDFFGSNIYKNPVENSHFLDNTESRFYRWKKLFSIKLFEYSVKNIRQNLKTIKPYYSRDNVKNIPLTYMDRSKESMKETSTLFEKYKYDENLSQCYKHLKEKYKDSEIIVFTTPVYIERFNHYRKDDFFYNYARWLKEIIGAFGEVNHFMYDNTFTSNPNNFFDASHFKPSGSHFLIESILKKQKNDYMIILDRNNLEKFLIKYSPKKQELKSIGVLDAI